MFHFGEPLKRQPIERRQIKLVRHRKPELQLDNLPCPSQGIMEEMVIDTQDMINRCTGDSRRCRERGDKIVLVDQTSNMNTSNQNNPSRENLQARESVTTRVHKSEGREQARYDREIETDDTEHFIMRLGNPATI